MWLKLADETCFNLDNVISFKVEGSNVIFTTVIGTQFTADYCEEVQDFIDICPKAYIDENKQLMTNQIVAKRKFGYREEC